MPKKKHKQNQTVVADEVVSKGSINSQQSESQPGATNPQEHGRSMTEMLGVLAVLGVLSIGGVQGYRYAMNKYHSNEVVNELNLLNAQLAMFMSGVHDDEAVMSLGAPYDNNEKIKTGGYAFSYGCGQDPDSMTPCDLDETGYYMTLNGVPEDVCKSASQMTANMMNLVEQRINGQTDNKGVLCQDENNQLTFLFDANDGQGFDNGEGDNVDVTDSHYSDTTDQYQEEITTTTPETTTTKIITNSYAEIETYTKTPFISTTPLSENTICVPATDSNSCPISGTKVCVQFTVTNKKNVGGIEFVQIKINGQDPNWYQANAACEAIGKRLPTVSELTIGGSNGWNDNWSYCDGCGYTSLSRYIFEVYGAINIFAGTSYSYSGNCYTHAVRSHSNETNGIYVTGQSKTSTYTALCRDKSGIADDYSNMPMTISSYPETISATPYETTTTYTVTPFVSTTTINYECRNNNDCSAGYYCDIMSYGDYNCSSVQGLCRNAYDNLRNKPTSAPFWISKNEMNGGISAQNFCEALGKNLISLSDFNCSVDKPYGTGHCDNEQIKAMYNAYGYHYAHVKSGSEWYRVSFGESGSGVCGSSCSSYSDYALCK